MPGTEFNNIRMTLAHNLEQTFPTHTSEESSPSVNIQSAKTEDNIPKGEIYGFTCNTIHSQTLT